MFDTNSRYAVLEDAVYISPDGRQVKYKRRRFLPQGEKIPERLKVRIEIGDRLDSIAARTLGDPELFWHICDANNCLNPFDLTADSEIGGTLRVPIPQFQEEQ